MIFWGEKIGKVCWSNSCCEPHMVRPLSIPRAWPTHKQKKTEWEDWIDSSFLLSLMWDMMSICCLYDKNQKRPQSSSCFVLVISAPVASLQSSVSTVASLLGLQREPGIVFFSSTGQFRLSDGFALGTVMAGNSLDPVAQAEDRTPHFAFSRG